MIFLKDHLDIDLLFLHNILYFRLIFLTLDIYHQIVPFISGHRQIFWHQNFKKIKNAIILALFCNIMAYNLFLNKFYWNFKKNNNFAKKRGFLKNTVSISLHYSIFDFLWWCFWALFFHKSKTPKFFSIYLKFFFLFAQKHREIFTQKKQWN